MIKFKNSKTKSVIVFLILFTLLSTSIINNCVSTLETKDNSYQICYGFIVPNFTDENNDIKEQMNYKIKNLVNDLLREEISVYWTTVNQTILVKKINNTEEPTTKFFEKGAFILKFTDDNKQDAKIVAIICDYNISSEIEDEDLLKIPVYEIMEPLDISVYKLTDTKIAQYRNIVTIGEMCILTTAEKCGFLNIEFFDHTNLAEKLNNDEFNVFLWPGGAPEFSSFYKTTFAQSLYEDLRFKISKTVRNFVNEGGGYIGSCYGAFRASSGMKFGPITIFFLRRVYNPKLNSLWFMSLSDAIINFPKKSVILPKTYSKIYNDSHPITYGLDNIVNDFIYNGPEFVSVGKNSQVIATYNDNNNPYNKRPSWLSSKFGKGTVAIFSGHPEIIGWENSNRSYDGITVMSNSLFFTTSEGIIQLYTNKTRDISFIEDIWSITLNLTFYLQNTEDVFKEIKTEINNTIIEINELNNFLNYLETLIIDIANEKNLDEEKLGYKSINVSTKNYLNPFVTYFENTLKTLGVLEKLYPTLKNETEFINNTENLKNDLKLKINETGKVISKSFNLSKDLENLLLKYKKSNIFSNLQILSILDKAHKFHWNVFFGYYHIPQTYFSSLKLLRNSWYNFEADLTIYNLN